MIGVVNSCTSAEDRRAAAEAAVNERLAAAGVPSVTDPPRFEPDATD
jgi:hypothetical protein